jgi:hypothetical protein
MKDTIEINGKDYYTMKEAADRLKMNYDALYHHVDKFETFRLGYMVLIEKNSLEKFIAYRNLYKK